MASPAPPCDVPDEAGSPRAASPAAEEGGPAAEAFVAADDAALGGEAGGVVLRYGGGWALPGLPARADFVAADARLGAVLAEHAAAGRDVFFAPAAVAEAEEYRPRRAYVLRLHGALLDGSKAEVTITGIPVFFDVRVPAGADAGAFEAIVRMLVAQRGQAEGASYARVAGLPGRGWGGPAAYVRVTTPTLAARRAALQAVAEAGHETAHDDPASYYRKAAREGRLPLADWAVLSGYEYAPGPTPASPLCAHVFRVPARGYAPQLDPLAPAAEREEAEARRARNPRLARARQLVVAWDIETRSRRGTGDLPDAAHPEDDAFMICLTAHWKGEAAPLAAVCLVDVDAEADPRWTTVVCGTPARVLEAFALAWRALAPDFVLGFNDSGYDWPFVAKKAEAFGILPQLWNTMSASPRNSVTVEGLKKYSLRADRPVKISSEERAFCTVLEVPGAVAVDVRVCLRRLHPRSEVPSGSSSLRFYLELCGLPGKADLPIRQLWAHHAEAEALAAEDAGGPPAPPALGGPAAPPGETPAERRARSRRQMRLCALYCVTDCLRPQELAALRGVLDDYREVSSLAFVSLADAHYNADGLKVCNLLGAFAFRRGIFLSFARRPRAEEGKYPGAFVFPPEKGLIPDPARLAAVEEAAAAAARGGGAARLEAALAAFGGDRPVTGLDFASLYPSIIIAYNLSPEKIILDEGEAEAAEAEGRELHRISFAYNGREVRAWAVRHGGRAEDFGLFPTVLLDLFDRRAAMKRRLGALASRRELLDGARGLARTEGLRLGAAVARLRARFAAEAAELEASVAPGAPPLAVAPGASPEEELAFVRRRAATAAANAEALGALLPGEAPADEGDAALEAEYARVCFDWTCLNIKQNALKRYMNTFYGETGNVNSPFFLLELAGGVTAAGQYNIKLVAEFVRSRGFRIKYGDSVTGDTALVLRRAGRVETCRIDELGADYEPYDDKEAFVPEGLEVWQDGGFTPVRRVIRHRAGKPIVRVLTHTGVVDCTTDHSLLGPSGERLAPGDISAGDELLHADPGSALEAESTGLPGGPESEGEAFTMGLFAADGSCGKYEYFREGRRSVKYSWAINNLDRALLERTAAGTPFPTKILETVRSSGVYKLVPVGSIKGPVLRYRALFYNAHREKRIPPEILAAPRALVQAFWDGFYAGDGDRAERERQTICRLDQKGKEMCTGLSLLGRRLGLQVSVNDRADKLSVFRLTFSREAGALRRPSDEVKRIRSMPPPEDGWVYDLETESAHFHVGPGALVVHNTDSLYLVPPPEVFAGVDADLAAGRLATRRDYFGAMVRATMRAMTAARAEVNAFLRRDNGTGYLSMAYEEVLYPAVMAGKKKYWAVAHVAEVNFDPEDLFVRGIDVVKQGQPGLAREIGWRIMRDCMAVENRRGLREIVEARLRDAVERPEQWAFDHFVKTDAWKPEKNNQAVQRFVARMRGRHEAEVAENARRGAAGEDPAPYLYELPEPGERFRYVIVRAGEAFDLSGRKAAPKKGDRMEFARAAQALGLPVDVAFYINNYVVGLCARFINSDAAFRSDDPLRADELSQRAAKKALEDFVKGLGGLDAATLRRRGHAYRRAFRGAAAGAERALAAAAGPAGAEAVAGGPWLPSGLLGLETADAASAELWATAAAHAAAAHAAAARKAGASAADGAPGGPGAAPPRRSALAAGFDRLEADLRARAAALFPAARAAALRYEAALELAVLRRRAEEHRAAPALGEAPELQAVPPEAPLAFAPEELAALAGLRRVWLAAAGLGRARAAARDARA